MADKYLNADGLNYTFGLIKNDFALKNGSYQLMTVGNLITDQVFRATEQVANVRTTGGTYSLTSGTSYVHALLGHTTWSGNTPTDAGATTLISVGKNLYNNSGTDGTLCPNGRALLPITSDTLFTINGGTATSLSLFASATDTTVVATITDFGSATYNSVTQQTFSTSGLSADDFPNGVFVEITADSDSDLSAMMINCLWSGYEVGCDFVAYTESIVSLPSTAVSLRSLELDDGTILRDYFGSVKETSTTYPFTKHIRATTLSSSTTPTSVGLSANTYDVELDTSVPEVVIGSETVSLSTDDSDTYTGTTSAGVSVSFVVSTLLFTCGLASATLTDNSDNTYSGTIKANYIAYVSIGTSTDLGSFTFGESMPTHGSSVYTKYTSAQMTTSISFTSGSGYMNIYSNRLYFAFDVLTYGSVASAYADIVLTPNLYSEAEAYSGGTTIYEWSFEAHDFGLEEWVASGNYPYAIMEYVYDVNRTVTTLPKNFVSRESAEDLLHEIGDLQGFDFDSIDYDEYTGKLAINGLVDTKETIISLNTIFYITNSYDEITDSEDILTIKSLMQDYKVSNHSSTNSSISARTYPTFVKCFWKYSSSASWFTTLGCQISGFGNEVLLLTGCYNLSYKFIRITIVATSGKYYYTCSTN